MSVVVNVPGPNVPGSIGETDASGRMVWHAATPAPVPMFRVTEANPAFDGHTYTSHPMSADELPAWVAHVSADGGHVVAITMEGE